MMATRLPSAAYIEFWSTAAAEEIGLCVMVHPDDQTKFINALYEARTEHGGFEELMIAQPEPRGTVFIIQKMVEMPA